MAPWEPRYERLTITGCRVLVKVHRPVFLTGFNFLKKSYKKCFFPKYQLSQQISAKSKMVMSDICSKLVDLAWNDLFRFYGIIATFLSTKL